MDYVFYSNYPKSDVSAAMVAALLFNLIHGQEIIQVREIEKHWPSQEGGKGLHILQGWHAPWNRYHDSLLYFTKGAYRTMKLNTNFMEYFKAFIPVNKDVCEQLIWVSYYSPECRPAMTVAVNLFNMIHGKTIVEIRDVSPNRIHFKNDFSLYWVWDYHAEWKAFCKDLVTFSFNKFVLSEKFTKFATSSAALGKPKDYFYY